VARVRPRTGTRIFSLTELPAHKYEKPASRNQPKTRGDSEARARPTSSSAAKHPGAGVPAANTARGELVRAAAASPVGRDPLRSFCRADPRACERPPAARGGGPTGGGLHAHGRERVPWRGRYVRRRRRRGVTASTRFARAAHAPSAGTLSGLGFWRSLCLCHFHSYLTDN